MLSKPLVSVIIAFYNEERFLDEAIKSILNQTYEEWELILVDDGSNDSSSRIANKYANKNRKVFYIEHENHSNKGVSASRNTGIYKANGKYIAFLDADDIWLPDKLNLQVDLMLANPEVGLIGEASEYWYYDHTDESKNRIKPIGKERDRVFLPYELIQVLYPLSSYQAPAPSGIMVKTEVARKHGGFEEHFIGKYQLYEDQTFLLKIYLNEPVYLSSLCNHRYRQREDSCVSRTKNDTDYNTVRKYFLEWLEQYMEQNNFRQKPVQKLLKRAFEPYRQPQKDAVRKGIMRVYSGIKRRISK
jgi:glycosyltransferase involved in cell wall biosynthesis